MRRNDITCYFLKELEICPVPAINVSGDSYFESKEWVVKSWDGERTYIKLLCSYDEEPSSEEMKLSMNLNDCQSYRVFSHYKQMREFLSPISSEIDIKSGARAIREKERIERSNAHSERMRREHEAAVKRKDEKQKKADERHKEQLERAKEWHRVHDSEI